MPAHMAFVGLDALSGRQNPVLPGGGQAQLIVSSPYLVEDVLIGLQTLRDILGLAMTKTPLMDAVVDWGWSVQPAAARRRRQRRGSAFEAFKTISDLLAALD